MMKRIAIILGAVLLLASCEPGTGLLAFFSASSFPAHLGLVVKAVDLSGRIEQRQDDDGCYNCNHLHFLNGFVFLAAHDSRLFIFNEDLQLLNGPIDHKDAYGTLGFINPALPGPPAITYYLGDFGYSNDPPGFSENTNPVGFRYGFGFYQGLPYAINQDGDNLELYDTGGFRDSITIGKTRLSGFAFDDSEILDSVFFFEEDYSDRDIKAVFLDSANYTTVFNEVAMAITDDAVDFLPAEDGRYYYTHYSDESGSHPGFVGVWNGTMRLVASDGKTIVSSISGYNTDRLAMAFDVNGKFFYLYDADQRALFRCRTWWSKR